jgi:hypothetical protein
MLINDVIGESSVRFVPGSATGTLLCAMRSQRLPHLGQLGSGNRSCITSATSFWVGTGVVCTSLKKACQSQPNFFSATAECGFREGVGHLRSGEKEPSRYALSCPSRNKWVPVLCRAKGAIQTLHRSKFLYALRFAARGPSAERKKLFSSFYGPTEVGP